jgi:ComF family protein
MKHLAEQPLAFAMGKLIGWRLLGELDQVPDLLVPVPMHWRRRIRRGSNTAEILAEAIQSVCDIPVHTAALRTTRLTQKQSLLSPNNRRANVRNAFAVKRSGALQGSLAKLHVGLVDDAVTTGATANSAARVLRKTGAAQVTVLAVARANR